MPALAITPFWAGLNDQLIDLLSDETLDWRPTPGVPVYWGDPEDFTGHYIAFHRLVHDVHHRTDILHRLDALGMGLPADRRPRPL
jgi:uncharacterized damage-inducible protein DinB